MKKWRLLRTDTQADSYMKMATDEAILLAVGQKKSPPTLRFYICPRPAVAIGYFQSIKKVLNLPACQKDKIEIFRRMTGGGAVYKHQEGELNYSLVIPENFSAQTKDILNSYRLIESGVIKGLARLGIKADFGGINDIMIEGKKISGNAQTRSSGAILQHGTILLDFNPELMLKYLKIPKIKMIDKKFTSPRTQVGTIKEYLPDLKINKLQKEIINGFADVFEVEFTRGLLSSWEKKTAQNLYDNKYTQEEWIYKR
ncbi:MAG TPA: lipoate--protein ligase family protein [Candidatus Vogelbacteria bacterium]|nr:lipoate--protein ligase family protein [Candidatus Vogelbacteria bacterium]